MSSLRMFVVLQILLLLTPSALFAQKDKSVVDPYLGPARTAELESWIKDYHEWEKWYRVYGNRFRVLGKRKERPDEPEWLRRECGELLVYESDLLSQACLILKDEEERRVSPGAAEMRSKIEEERSQREALRKTSFLEWMNFDSAWTELELNTNKASRTYGLFGFHLGIPVPQYKKVQVGTGVMVFSTTVNFSGKREMKVSPMMVLGYKLFDFTFFGRGATAHINMAKALMLGARNDIVDTSTTVGGFSITFKK